MAKIQLTNLQYSHQLTPSDLKQVVGSSDPLDRWLKTVFNENTTDGAINTAIIHAHGRAFMAGDMNQANQLLDALSQRIEAMENRQAIVNQIVFPG